MRDLLRLLGKIAPQSPVMGELLTYTQIYCTTPLEPHFNDVKVIFDAHYRAIMNGPSNVQWLMNAQNPVIMSIPGTNGRVHLSFFYTSALQNSAQKRQEIDGFLPEERSRRLAQAQEVAYPDQFLLYWYRLCNEIATDAEKVLLSKHVKECETRLGLSTPEPEISSLSGLLGAATSLLGSKGFNLSGLKIPDNLESTATSLLQSPEVKDLVAEAMTETGIQSLEDVGRDPSTFMMNTFGKIMSTLQDPSKRSKLTSKAMAVLNVPEGQAIKQQVEGILGTPLEKIIPKEDVDDVDE